MSNIVDIYLDQISEREGTLILRSSRGTSKKFQFRLPWVDAAEWNAVFQYLRASEDYEETWKFKEATIEKAKMLKYANRDDKGSPLSSRLKKIGRELYSRLFDDRDVHHFFQEALDELKSHSHQETAIVALHLTETGSILQAYPWELLHNGHDFLFKSKYTLIRYIDIQQRVKPVAIQDSFNLLLADPRPEMSSTYHRLPKSDRKVLREYSEKDGKLACHALPESAPTLEEIMHVVVDEDIHGIHVDAHGDFGWLCRRCKRLNPHHATECQHEDCGAQKLSDQQAQGYLAFRQADNSVAWVDGESLGIKIAKPTINFAMLSSCDSGLSGGGSVFNSVAGALIKQGVSAVVAMQFPVENRITKTFIEFFYKALLKPGSSVVDAFNTAKRSIVERRDAWYRPALYLCLDHDNIEGRFFDVRQPEQAAQNFQTRRLHETAPHASNTLAEPELVFFQQEKIALSYLRESSTDLQQRWTEGFLADFSKLLSLNGQQTFKGRETETPEALAALEQAAIVLPLISQNYLDSPCWTTFSKHLHECKAHLLLIEKEQVVMNEPAALLHKSAGRYRFWDTDKRHGFMPEDPSYSDLLIDLKKKIQDLKESSGQASKQTITAAEARATVLLAEVTDDLYHQREEVKRYLTQQQIRVLPEAHYPLEPQAFKKALRQDLEQSTLFVQLLSNIPFKKIPDLPQGRVRCQYELALETQTQVLQWRSSEIVLAEIPDPEQRDFLQVESVLAVGLEEFKTETVNRALPAPIKRQQKALPSFVVKWDDNDAELIADIFVRLQEFSKECFPINFSCPRPSAWKTKLGSHILYDKDGLIIVYGNASPDWVHEQYEQAITIIPKERGEPFAAVGIYDGPPEEKDFLFLHNPSVLHILNCRTNFNEKEILEFIGALQAGGAL